MKQGGKYYTNTIFKPYVKKNAKRYILFGVLILCFVKTLRF